ncbi:tyrosine phosphatase-like protein [Dioszegia hungarica]|uniref:Very-long-chain (3R)-3-hydroxyacyl-CoA dehydratase n=1 Tax=Dioszegia hungarica TaxID=4972 RepID=A0AA38H4Z3_9TREE|nr:tyrosine phosphatase-like protein [Dioszegia hungarica]KAI9632921.1 tyrosine phosphatase-like protein [Dioszegia hungarica]
MSNRTQNVGQRAELEKERIARQGKQLAGSVPKTRLTPLKIYLLAYNVISAALWANLLYITVSFLLTGKPGASNPSSYLTRLASLHPVGRKAISYMPFLAGKSFLSGSYNYKNLGWLTKWTQTLAVLEVVHAALGWVRSPILTTASQVASRVYTVWGVVEAVPKTHSNPLFTTMLLAWSLTEVIRYTYYATSLLGIKIRALDWLRYTTFLPLYPLGAASEAFISFSTLPPISKLLPDWLIAKIPTNWGRALLWNMTKSGVKSKVGATREWGAVDFWRLGLFLVWWPSLYVLYTYMLKQRKRVLGTGKVVGRINKAN